MTEMFHVEQSAPTPSADPTLAEREVFKSFLSELNVSRETSVAVAVAPRVGARDRLRAEQSPLNKVSRETLDVVMAKFDRYAALLQEWNQRFNLVAASTLPHIWSRHFLDSAQLVKYLPDTPEKPVLVDMGSGAGFPGIVLAILTNAEIHMVESTGKKANFLRTVIEELGLTAQVHQERIEAVRGIKADIITARALALLPDLLKMAHRFLTHETVCVFLKGRNAPEELTEAKKYWTFGCKKSPSLTDSSGSVLVLRHVQYNIKGRPSR